MDNFGLRTLDIILISESPDRMEKSPFEVYITSPYVIGVRLLSLIISAISNILLLHGKLLKTKDDACILNGFISSAINFSTIIEFNINIDLRTFATPSSEYAAGIVCISYFTDQKWPTEPPP